MKREQSELDLQKAFAPMPDACREALMDAVHSVKEEKPVKHASFRAVLIAAIIILATMAVAFAAQELGWVDFYSGFYGVSVPQAAKELMEATKPVSYQVGPMTFTYTQLISDGRIALGSATVRMTDGTEVLLAADSDIYDAVDANGFDVLIKRYGLAPGTSWVDAAKQLKLPLYGIRALLEVDEAYDGGEAMSDALWNEDGAISYFSMPLLNKDAVQGELPVTLYMAVHRYDAETDELEINAFVDRQQTSIAVSPMMAEKTYVPEGDGVITLPESKRCDYDADGNEVWSVVPPIPVKLVSVHAEQFATGVYLSATVTLPDELDADASIEAVYRLSICDEHGEALPIGMSLSGNANVDALPTAVLEDMVTLDSLPDALMVTDGTTQLLVK